MELLGIQRGSLRSLGITFTHKTMQKVDDGRVDGLQGSRLDWGRIRRIMCHGL